MRIGLPREIKTEEYRVALTPSAVAELCAHGHQVLMEPGAGLGAGFGNDAYQSAGARLLADAESVFEQAELIIKVKEPQPEESERLRSDHTLFTFLHLAAEKQLTGRLQGSGATCIAYETITDSLGRLPILTPMSQIAGRLSVQAGAADMVASMRQGSVIVDVAIDQGGCCASSRPTTHTNPTFTVDGVIHYCVANMPGAVPATASQALSHVTLPWLLELADKGVDRALSDNPHLRDGLNVQRGEIIHPAVADSLKV